MKYFFPCVIIILISACASTPSFDTAQVDPSLTPELVTRNLAAGQGKSVLWGGLIINTRNLKQTTQIEVLAYPLNSSHQPQRDQAPQGRFLVTYQGFLEPSDYSQGRMITVLGTVRKLQQGKIGETDYLYPELDTRQLHLWAQDTGQSRTRFHIGIGIGL